MRVCLGDFATAGEAAQCVARSPGEKVAAEAERGGVQTDGAGVGMARASGPEVPSPRAAMEIARMCCVVLGLFEGDSVRNIIPCV